MRPRRKAARRAVQNISGVLKGEDDALSNAEERSDQRQSLRLRRTRSGKRLFESTTQVNSSSSSESTSVVSGRARWRLPADSLSESSSSSQFSTEREESSSEAVSEEEVAWTRKRQQRRSKELKREEPRHRLALCPGNGAFANISSLGLDRRRVLELQPVDMWQLPATWRLLQVFSKRLGIPDLTPMELEHALEAPQFAPVLAEIMASLVGFRSSGGHQVEQGASRTTVTLQRADWVQRADSLWFPLFVRFFRQHIDEMVALGLCSEPCSTSNPSSSTPELSTLESGGWEAFLQLSASQRLLLLYALCEYVLCNPDEDHKYVKDLRQLRHDDLRILPVGMDRHGALYWYFDDNCRLYREWFSDPGDPTAKNANHRRKTEKSEYSYGWIVAAEGPESLRDLMKALDDARPRSSERALRQWLERELLPTWEEHGRKLERLSRRRERLERLLATKRTSSRVQEMELARQREEELRKQREEEERELERQRRREEQERQRELERIERLAKRQRLEIERALRAAERERAEAEARQSRHERVLARNETQSEADQGERAASAATGSLAAEDTLTCEEDIPPEMNLSGYVEDNVADEGVEKLDAAGSVPYRVLTWFRIMDAESGEHACLDSLELEQSSQKATARRPLVPRTSRSLIAEGLLVPGSGAGSVKLRPIMIRTGRILEWCIDYGEVCIWIRTDRAWYKLVTPHPSHEPHYVTTRRKFELAIRVSILCASFPNSKACSFRNLSKLLALPYGEMRGYTPEEIIEEAQFLVQQAEMLDRPEMRDNAFMRRLRREIEAAAQRERARLQRRQQRAAQRMRQQNRESVATIPTKILIKWDHHMANGNVTNDHAPVHQGAGPESCQLELNISKLPHWSIASSRGPGLFFTNTPCSIGIASTEGRDQRKRAPVHRHWWIAASYGPGIWWLRTRQPRRRPLREMSPEETRLDRTTAQEHVIEPMVPSPNSLRTAKPQPAVVISNQEIMTDGDRALSRASPPIRINPAMQSRSVPAASVGGIMDLSGGSRTIETLWTESKVAPQPVSQASHRMTDSNAISFQATDGDVELP